MLPLKLTCSECGREYTKGCVIKLGESQFCDRCNPFVFDEDTEEDRGEAED